MKTNPIEKALEKKHPSEKKPFKPFTKEESEKRLKMKNRGNY